MMKDFIRSNQFLIIAILAGIVIWPLDVLIDSNFFYENGFFEGLFYPSAIELYFRSVLSILFFSIGIYAQITITKRKLTEKELKTAKTFSDSLVDTAPMIVLVLNPNATIRFINPYMEQLSGYKLDEVMDRDWFSTFLPDGDWSETRKLFKKAISNINTQGHVNPITTKDGREHIIEWYDQTLRDSNNQTIGLLAIGQDITGRKQLEEQLFQSQKMEAIGTLVGGIAHDFNNMLAGVTGNLYLAKELSSEMPDVVEKLDKAENIAFRAANMIQQLLTFARKDIVSVKQIPLNPFLKETLKLLSTSVPENVKLHQEVCSDPLQINGDAIQLHQVLLNLINNARDAVEGVDSPAITIRLEAWHPDETLIGNHSYFKDKPYAHLSIEDNGCGIPEHQIEHLFEPFFTTKGQGKGTGLGLSMTFGAIKNHHGFIEVESIEGMGTTFHLYIPLLRQAEEIIVTPAQEKEIAKGHGEVILLVDDEPEVIKTSKEVLESLDYKVLTASDGHQAVELFKAHADEIDLCLLDIVMPIMSGDKAAQCLRQIKPDVKIIFSTGYDKSIMAGMGNETVLRKPYHIDEVSFLIRTQLDSRELKVDKLD